MRIILFENRREHSKPLFTSLGLLTFDDIYKVECTKLMFEVAKGNVDCIRDFLHLTVESHGIRTRQASSGYFSQLLIGADYESLFLTNSGVKTRNSNIKSATSKKVFSCHFKQLVLQECK